MSCFVSWIYCCVLLISIWFDCLYSQPNNHHHTRHSSVDHASTNHTILESSIFAGKRVFGNIILIDLRLADIIGKEMEKNNVTQKVNARQNALNRIKHSKHTMAQLPFKINWWKAFLGTLCPHQRDDILPNARGVTLAHYQIWHDFVKQEEHNITGLSDDDVIVVFEDDAQIVVPDIVPYLEKEIKHMPYEWKYLGWCLESPDKQHNHNSFAFCTHAYIMTRRGAKVMLPVIDWCGNTIELQMWDYISTHNDFSYGFPDRSFENYIIIPDYYKSFTKGLFVQKKGFASFNDHGSN